MKISLWATNIGATKRNMAEWLATVHEKLMAAKVEGASLLVMPEYACAHWLSFGKMVPLHDEIAWLADTGMSVIPSLTALVERHGVGLLAGTIPTRIAGGYVNRAVLILPHGTFHQDKLALTPWERDVEGWNLVPGSVIRIVRWGHLRLAVAICLDVEVPTLAARLSELDVDLLIVPSMTESLAGYERVFGCAKARAIELACPVAAVGAIGTLVLPGREEANTSGAAVFVPCEPANARGVVASMGPFTAAPDDGPILHVDLPIDECRGLRRGNAEVWPPRLPATLTTEETS